MPGAGLRAKSRVEEVEELLSLMKERGVSTLRVGDIELSLAPSVSERTPADDVPLTKILSAEERERADIRRRRQVSLGAGPRIVERAGE